MSNAFERIFKNRTVFVTGHTGFIGSWLVQWLCDLGANVVGYSLEPPTNPSLFETIGLEKRLEHIIGNINDHTKLQNPYNLDNCIATNVIINFSIHIKI